MDGAEPFEVVGCGGQLARWELAAELMHVFAGSHHRSSVAVLSLSASSRSRAPTTTLYSNPAVEEIAEEHVERSTLTRRRELRGPLQPTRRDKTKMGRSDDPQSFGVNGGI